MKTFLLATALSLSLFGGTYDYDCASKLSIKSLESNETNITKQNLDRFFYGEFEEIVRFEALYFEGSTLKNREQLEDIITIVKNYIAREKEILIKIIGHSSETTDKHHELVVDSDTYANALQNVFRPSLSWSQSQEQSKKYANIIQMRIVDSGINQDITVVENRRDDDIGFTDATSEGRDLSNRVMVSMYVLVVKNIDSDEDGVYDKTDECPDSPKGYEVDTKGCTLDSDGDGVYDYEDKCPNTPKDVTVDKKGCPLDSDNDGVYDYKDKCPNTLSGLNVDVQGCPIGKTLALHFATNSDKIVQSSYHEVVEFANFMELNPAFKAEIIGHTDSVGPANFNMNLSQRRARATKIALISEGVSPSRLSSRGKGEIEPIQSNRTPEGRKANRRIEVQLSLVK